MASYYVRSTDGDDGSDGLSWANAKATLTGAFAVATAGDTIYVSQAHAETTAAAITLLSPGTATAPCFVLCVSDAAEPPTALASSATISTTGASNLVIRGSAYFYGLTFVSGNGASASTLALVDSVTAAGALVFDTCSLQLGGNSGSSLFQVGSSSVAQNTLIKLINTSFSFANASQSLQIRSGRVEWWRTGSAAIGGAAVLGTMPTTFINTGNSTFLGGILFDGVDLSPLSGKNIYSQANNHPNQTIFRNCKLPASVTRVTGTNTGQGRKTWFINCNSGDVNYDFYSEDYNGIITHDASVTRTGGASDGATSFARKMVSSANTKFHTPLISDPIILWNDSLAEQTITIPVATDNITLTDGDAWIEVQFLGVSGYPLGSGVSDRKTNILATATNQTTDSSSTWNNVPGTPVKQSLSVTLTAAEKGPMAVRVCLAKPSTTLYFDPKVSGSRQWQYNEASIDAGGGASGGSFCFSS